MYKYDCVQYGRMNEIDEQEEVITLGICCEEGIKEKLEMFLKSHVSGTLWVVSFILKLKNM